jgi:hypothetical protein
MEKTGKSLWHRFLLEEKGNLSEEFLLEKYVIFGHSFYCNII